MPKNPKSKPPSSSASSSTSNKSNVKTYSLLMMGLVVITLMAIPTLPSTSSFVLDVQRNVTASDASFLPHTQQQQVSETTPPIITSIPQDNDNDKIPGPIMNDKLHILGIRLTTSYEKLDESVFVDMFCHGVGEGANVGFHVVKTDPLNQLSYQEATKQIMYAKVHVDNNENNIFSTTEGTNSSTMAADRIKMEYIPSKSIDFNTVGTHLIWRANVSALVSKSQLMARSHLRVSIYTNFENPHHSDGSPLLTVDIPMDTAALGHAGPVVKHSKKSFLQQAQDGPPLGVVLCVAGVDAGGLWYLPEFIQHHLNVGIQHIFLGVNGGEKEYAILKEKLAYYIEDLGVVVLGGESTVMENRQVRKLRFYNQCLFHAKGMAEYVVNWDVDELWMPPVVEASNNHHGPGQSTIEQHKEDSIWKNSPYSDSLSLLEAIRMVRGENGCMDWCYQTIPSYTIHRIEQEQGNATHPQYQGYYGFTHRAKDPNYQWHKPIIRTKYAFQSSFHLGGSCMMPTPTQQPEVDHAYSPMNRGCPMYKQNVSLGSMHHYYWLFRPEWGLESPAKFPDLDEYTQQLRSTTVAQLVQLQKEDKINITGAKYQGHGSKIDTA